MGYVLLVFALLLALGSAVAFGACRPGTSAEAAAPAPITAPEEATGGGEPAAPEPPQPAPAAEGAPPTVLDVTALGREGIRERLRSLKRRPGPDKVSRGAMCYKPVAAKKHLDYVCPKCQAHTQYARRDDAYDTIKHSLAACRAVAEQVQGLRLDESELCRRCRPSVKEPQAWLEFTYKPGEAPHRVSVSRVECTLIVELLQGANTHTGSRDRTSALKDHMDRLEALFGVAADPGGSDPPAPSTTP